MKLYPSQQFGQQICNYLVTTAIRQACNATCDIFHGVVVQHLDVFCYLNHRGRRCKYKRTLIVNVNSRWTWTSLDDWNALCRSVNPRYILHSSEIARIFFINKTSNKLLLSFSTRHCCTTCHPQTTTHILPYCNIATPVCINMCNRNKCFTRSPIS